MIFLFLCSFWKAKYRPDWAAQSDFVIRFLNLCIRNWDQMINWVSFVYFFFPYISIRNRCYQSGSSNMSVYCRCGVHTVQHTNTSVEGSRTDTIDSIGVDNNGAHHQSSSLKSIINYNSTVINLIELYLLMSATLCPQYILCYAVNCVFRRLFLSSFDGMKKKIRKFNVVSDWAAMRGREREMCHNRSK